MSFFLSEINPVYVFRRKGDINDPFVSVNEIIKVNETGLVILKEIPSRFDRVLIDSYFEVQKHEGLKNNEFFVDYSLGIVYFSDFNIGKSLGFKYMGSGVVSLGSSRVFVEDNGVHPTKSLQDLIDEAKGAIEGVADYDEQVSEIIQTANNKVIELESARQSAITQANRAKVEADRVESTLESVQNTLAEVNNTVVEANNAISDISTALTSVGQAITDVGVAKTNTETATRNAEDAKDRVEQKILEFNAKVTEINSAISGAIKAKTDTEAVIATASQAIIDLNNLRSSIVTATQNAVNATNEINSLLTTINSAISSAETATSIANTSATNANTKAQLADSKATLAGEKASLAESATATANSKISEMNTLIPLVSGLENKGDYNNSIVYKKNNLVSYQGSTYQAKIDTVGNLPDNADYWALFAKRGIDGVGSISTVNSKSPDVNGNIELKASDIGASPTGHMHTIANVTGLQGALDAKETPTGAQTKATTALNSAKSYTDTKVADIVGSAPETLDTLNELATALGNDPNFATTMANLIGNKVDKVSGKVLSTNDFTTTEKSKLAGIATGAQVNTITSVAGRTGAVVLTKNDVGLTNLDNVKQASKTEFDTHAGLSASTTVKGHVQLTDATNSTSLVLAPTANAVKKAYDLANSKANALHEHTISDVIGLQSALDSKDSGVQEDIDLHKIEIAPHQYGGKFEWRYNPTHDSLDLVMLDE